MNIKHLEEGHFYFTSESVTEGHPDKLCDILSDAILDACLEQDPKAISGCEAIAKSNMILIAGEITTTADIDIEAIVRNKIKEIGYDDEKKGLDYKTCEVIQKVTKQSGQITQAVQVGEVEETCAGDQGHMFGYATDETKELFPFSHLIALRLSEKLAEVRKNKTLPWVRPDGKTQVTVEYKKDDKSGNITPIRVHTILISTQHDPDIKNEDIRAAIQEYVINPVVPKEYLDENTKYYINPSNQFIIGGPEADAGLTGRKIIVDTYGGWGGHGGGCFSGKDPSKVDRTGCYAARWIAKSLVTNGLCKRALVQIAYSIGLPDPLSIHINSYETVVEGKSDKDLFDIVVKNFNLTFGHIIKDLNLRRPIYTKTASYGHFGREDKDFTWEIPRVLKF
jgi:S-adenosylmethionine synthetase